MNIKNLTVVGGGTAGFIPALILKSRFPDINIQIIRSSKIGIVGVGEGSTEHWSDLMTFLQIHPIELIKECDATYKLGIMFEGWSEKPYLHSVIGNYALQAAQYNYIYGKIIAEGRDAKDMTSSVYWDNKLETEFLEDLTLKPASQFHFNTNKLNDFLTRKAEQLGIDIIDDEINDIILTSSNNIEKIVGEKNTYNSDFFIDATGFKRLLITKLGAKWQSYRKYLKAKAAIAFPMSDTDNYNLWTLAKAMDYGWMFRLPVWGRYGNGYIFDSDFISHEQAKEEVDKFFGRDIEVAKTFSFDPGALDRVWINNCCAIGLSSSFVEPMEASSIGTSIQQSFLLMHRLPNYDQEVIDRYNKSVTDILNNIRDFVALHYITKKENTEYWKSLKSVELPDSLKEKLKIWKYKLPIREDFSELSKYILFKENNFILVMHGLGLFDRESIKLEYDSLDTCIKNDADRIFNSLKQRESTFPKIIHKEYLRSIRENFIRK
jgi:tryptophan halogenase